MSGGINERIGISVEMESKELDDFSRKLEAHKKKWDTNKKSVDMFSKSLERATAIRKKWETMQQGMTKQIQQQKVITQQAQQYSQVLSQSNANAIKGMFAQQTAQKGLVGWINKGKEGLMGFNGAALSTLFFGMELQRVFGGAVKSIFEGYKKLIPESHMFNVMTTRLSANWEFFKFQLADALAQSPLFQKFIGFAIGLVQAFQKLPESMKTIITTSALVFAALGTFLFAKSIIKLGLAGLIDEFGGLKGAMMSAKTSAVALGGVLAFAVAIAGMNKLDNLINTLDSGKESSEKMNKVLEDLGVFLVKDLSSAFTSSAGDVQSWTEALIWLGAIQRNLIGSAIIGFTAFGTTIKSVFNVLTFVVQSFTLGFLEGIKWIVDAVQELADFAGLDSISDKLSEISKGFADPVKTLTDGMTEDVQDLINGAEIMKKTFDEINAARVDPDQLIGEYREQLVLNSSASDIRGLSRGETTNVTNINVMTAADALSEGLISNEQFNDFMEARQSNPFITG